MALFVTNKTQVQDLIIVSYKLQETQGIGLIFKFQVSILVLNFQRIFTNNFEEGIVSWKCNRSDE